MNFNFMHAVDSRLEMKPFRTKSMDWKSAQELWQINSAPPFKSSDIIIITIIASSTHKQLTN